MDRIELSKKQRKLLREIADGRYPNCCHSEDNEDILVLKGENLIQGTEVSDGSFIALSITDFGRAYLRRNPRLKNPSIWQDKKYVINTTISIAALIISIIALLK